MFLDVLKLLILLGAINQDYAFVFRSVFKLSLGLIVVSVYIRLLSSMRSFSISQSSILIACIVCFDWQFCIVVSGDFYYIWLCPLCCLVIEGNVDILDVFNRLILLGSQNASMAIIKLNPVCSSFSYSSLLLFLLVLCAITLLPGAPFTNMV